MEKYRSLIEGLEKDVPYARQCAIEYFTQKIQREKEARARAQIAKYSNFLNKLYHYCPQIFEGNGMTANSIAFVLSDKEGYPRYSCGTVASMINYTRDCLIGWRNNEAAQEIKKILCNNLGVKKIDFTHKRDERGIETAHYTFITE